MTIKITVGAQCLNIFEVEEMDGVDAGLAVLHYDGNDSRVRPIEIGSLSPKATYSVDDIIYIEADDGADITESVKSQMLRQALTPRPGLIVGREDDHPKILAMNMARILDVLEYTFIRPRVAAFLGVRSLDDPVCALEEVDRGARIWWAPSARDLLLTLHDYMEYHSPKGSYFGYQPGQKDLGFWPIRPLEDA